MSTRILKVLFQGDSSDLEQASQRAGGALGQLDGQAQKAADGTRKLGSESQQAGGSVGTLDAGVGKLAGRLGALAAGYASLSAARGWVADFAVQEQAVASLDAALASMGRTSVGLSGQLQALASEIQREGIIGDEAIIKGQSFLATYGAITDEMLPRTTRAMTDLAAKMGGDVVSAANMMGKAAEGMTDGLARSGIIISDAAKESGDFATVLGEIEAQIGGMNRALGETKSGALTQLSNAAGDVREQLGEIIAIGLHEWARDTSQSIGFAQETVDELGGALAYVVGLARDGMDGVSQIPAMAAAGWGELLGLFVDTEIAGDVLTARIRELWGELGAFASQIDFSAETARHGFATMISWADIFLAELKASWQMMVVDGQAAWGTLTFHAEMAWQQMRVGALAMVDGVVLIFADMIAQVRRATDSLSGVWGMEGIAESVASAEQALRGYAGSADVARQSVVNLAQARAREIDTLQQMRDGIISERDARSEAARAAAVHREAVEELTGATEEATGSEERLAGALADGERAAVSSGRAKEDLAKRTDELEQATERLLRSLDPLRGQYAAHAEGMATLDAALAAGMIGHEEYGRAVEALDARLGSAIERTSQMSGEMERLLRGVDPLRGAYAEYAKGVEELDKALAANLITQKQYGDVLFGLDNKLQDAVNGTVRLAETTEGAAKDTLAAVSQMENAWGNFIDGFVRSAFGGFDSVKDYLKKTLADMVAMAASQQIQVMLGFGGGGAGGVAGALMGGGAGGAGGGGVGGGVGGMIGGAAQWLGGTSALQGTGVGNFLTSQGAAAGAMPSWQFGAAGLIGGIAGQAVWGNDQASMGASLGAMAGQALIPIPVVGAAIGGVAGGFLGNMFASKPSDMSQEGTLDLATGRADLWGMGEEKYSAQNEQIRNQMLGALSQYSAAAQELTGAVLDEQIRVIVGSRDGLRLAIGDELGRSYDIDFDRYDGPEQAVQAAMEHIFDRAMEGATGLSDDVRAELERRIAAQPGGDPLTILATLVHEREQAQAERAGEIMGAYRGLIPTESIRGAGAGAISGLPGSSPFSGMSVEGALVGGGSAASAASGWQGSGAAAAAAERSRVANDEALARALEYAEAMGRLQEALAVDPVADFERAMRTAEMSSVDLYRAQADGLVWLSGAVDDSAQGLGMLAEGLGVLRESALQLLMDVEAAAAGVSGRADSFRRDLEFGGMDREGQYNYLREEIRDLHGSLASSGSPEEIVALTQQIESLTRQAWGLLDPAQQDDKRAEFIDFVTTYEQEALERLAMISEEAMELFVSAQESVAEVLERPVGELEDGARRLSHAGDSLTSAAAYLGQSGQVMAEAAVAMATASTQGAQEIANAAARAVASYPTYTIDVQGV